MTTARETIYNPSSVCLRPAQNMTKRRKSFKHSPQDSPEDIKRPKQNFALMPATSQTEGWNLRQRALNLCAPGRQLHYAVTYNEMGCRCTKFMCKVERQPKYRGLGQTTSSSSSSMLTRQPVKRIKVSAEIKNDIK